MNTKHLSIPVAIKMRVRGVSMATIALYVRTFSPSPFSFTTELAVQPEEGETEACHLERLAALELHRPKPLAQWIAQEGPKEDAARVLGVSNTVDEILAERMLKQDFLDEHAQSQLLSRDQTIRNLVLRSRFLHPDLFESHAAKVSPGVVTQASTDEESLLRLAAATGQKGDFVRGLEQNGQAPQFSDDFWLELPGLVGVDITRITKYRSKFSPETILEHVEPTQGRSLTDAEIGWGALAFTEISRRLRYASPEHYDAENPETFPDYSATRLLAVINQYRAGTLVGVETNHRTAPAITADEQKIWAIALVHHLPQLARAWAPDLRRSPVAGQYRFQEAMLTAVIAAGLDEDTIRAAASFTSGEAQSLIQAVLHRGLAG